MTLKQRLALYLSAAFAALFGLALLFIYFSFSAFRSQEFADRLREEAMSDLKLLFEIKNTDKQLLKTIDNNSVHKLYNEKTLIFDANQHLVYSSVPDALVQYNPQDLKILKAKSSFFRERDGQELFGLRYEFGQATYYAIVIAEDIYGLSKLRYLAYSLLLVFASGIVVVWLVTYQIVVQLVKPLDTLQQKVADITVHELDTQLPENEQKNEINLLSKSFNQMLRRIENAYAAQKGFTANASHELRTPISRLRIQLDSLMRQPQTAEVQNYLENMSGDVNQMADLVQSLLLLAKLNTSPKHFKNERIDEVIFDACQVVKKQFLDFQMSFEVLENQDFIPDLEMNINHSLLEIAFINLFKNAYLYSNNRKIAVKIEQPNENAPLQILFTNTGDAIEVEQADKIFDSFVRGSNAQRIAGSGLGLRIVKCILDYHQASISYNFVAPNAHQFVVRFNKNSS
jgi:two-component system, OmpR family, sensor histidine kinase ArlS